MKTTYNCLKFRNFCGKERQGFVIIFKDKIPEVILEDILFQLFEPLYKHIYCPEIYYFSHSQQIIEYKDLTQVNEYIYVHFLQRGQQYMQNKKLEGSLKLCDLNAIAAGFSIKGFRMYIFSEKQYLIYKNKKMCDMVYERINGITNQNQRLANSLDNFISIIEPLTTNQKVGQMRDTCRKQISQLRNTLQELNTLEQKLLVVDDLLKEAGKQVGVELKSLNSLGFTN